MLEGLAVVMMEGYIFNAKFQYPIDGKRSGYVRLKQPLSFAADSAGSYLSKSRWISDRVRYLRRVARIPLILTHPMP